LLSLLGQLICEASAEVRGAARKAFAEVSSRAGSRDAFLETLRKCVAEPGHSKLRALVDKELDGLAVRNKGNFA
jgi:hypothetical protein